MNLKTEVFISYRRTDYNYAKLIYDEFDKRGISAWYDELIELGDDWRDAVVEHISKSKLMLILISSQALQSDELKKELALANQVGVELVTVRLEDIQLEDAFAYELSRNNWFDIFKSPQKDVKALVDKLESKLNDETKPKKSTSSKLEKSKQLNSSNSNKYLINISNIALMNIFIISSFINYFIFPMYVNNSDNQTSYDFVQLATTSTVGSPLVFLIAITNNLITYSYILIISSFLNSLILFIIVIRFYRYVSKYVKSD